MYFIYGKVIRVLYKILYSNVPWEFQKKKGSYREPMEVSVPKSSGTSITNLQLMRRVKESFRRV